MEDLTLALITLTAFVLLFVVAIFADRAGVEAADVAEGGEPVLVPVEDAGGLAVATGGHARGAVVARRVDADVA